MLRPTLLGSVVADIVMAIISLVHTATIANRLHIAVLQTSAQLNTHKSERKALLLFLPVLNSELPKRGTYLGVDGGTLKKPKCLWGHYKHEPECVLTGAQNL